MLAIIGMITRLGPLIGVLAVVLSIGFATATQSRLNKTKEQLSLTEQRLSTTTSALTATSKELTRTRQDLSSEQHKTTALQLAIDEQNQYVESMRRKNRELQTKFEVSTSAASDKANAILAEKPPAGEVCESLERRIAAWARKRR